MYNFSIIFMGSEGNVLGKPKSNCKFYGGLVHFLEVISERDKRSRKIWQVTKSCAAYLPFWIDVS